MNLLLSVFVVVLVASTTAANAQPKLPSDVARYVERRDQCDHFRGEEPYDVERRKFLVKRVREYCKGTDAQLVALHRKYKTNPKVLATLKEYELNIEAP